MPSLTAQIIARKRVTDAIREALASSCLVVLSAPVGHGKTTAAQQVMADWKARSLYLRMLPGWQDNADYLWRDLCKKLKKQDVLEADKLKLTGVPDDGARLYRCLDYFCEYLAAAPTLLVVDDFHNLDGSPVTRFFEYLVNEEIPGFNLLILSRTKPQMPLAYFESKGYASLLDSTVLEFSNDEARELFGMAGENDPELADIARDFSQGWAAALRLCLQGYISNSVVKPVKNIDNLLSETFFSTYSIEEQCLLLQLSVLETFTAEQAAFISGDQQAASILKRLYEHNAFIQYSPATDAYFIHSLLRSFLTRSLAENSIEACSIVKTQLLYRRAAECSLREHNYLQAMRLFAQAGDEDDLLQILLMFETPGEGYFLLPDPENALEIIESIPWKIRFLSPIGYLGFIHRYMVRVDKEKASSMLLEAQNRFLKDGGLSEEQQIKICGEIELILAVQNFNDFEAMGECYERADKLLPGRSQLVDKAMFWTFNCPHSAFLYLKIPGGYASLEKVVAEKLVYFQNVSAGSNAGAVELLSAERQLETGRLQHAEELLHTAKYKALENKQFVGIIAANFILARQRLASGQVENIYELFQSLHQAIEVPVHSDLLYNLEVCTGYIASVSNDMEHIPSWLLQHEPIPVKNNQAHAFPLIVRGKAILATENWARLQAFADEAEAKTAYLGALFIKLHILIFKAVAAANLQTNNLALSEKYLADAINLAKHDGIVTSLAEYGRHLYPLLQRFSNLYPERRDLGMLQRMTKKYAQLGKKHVSKLTLHEMDIMKMVRNGANNKDISSKMGITQGSVANNLSRIYTKLGVGSRVEAINKWAEESSVNV